VNHRHLLPNEIDLLVDEEVGFGVAPLRGHVRDCAECRAQLEGARAVASALEELPHFAPSHRFIDRVLAEVPIFVPWHVAARDTALRWMPQSRPGRLAALAFSTTVASVLTLGILWITTQTNALVFATGVASSRGPAMVSDALRDGAAALFGDQVFAAIHQTGTIGLAIMLLGLVGAAAGSIVGLRAIATASSRRRS
jgi:hypothetical protein